MPVVTDAGFQTQGDCSVTAELTGVEIRNPNVRRGPFRAAMFDFDGTVSLLREGWSRVMAEMGAELLNDPAAKMVIEREMLMLSGKPSIFQMHRLAAIAQERGHQSPDPEVLLKEFLRRLFAIADHRKAHLAAGTATPAQWSPRGTHALLDNLRNRGVKLYLASGTDLEFVRQEAELLNLTHYFGEHIYAPAHNTPDFSKRTVIEKILQDNAITSDKLIGFGDGYSETVEMNRAGGVAVGIASVEPPETGIHPMKREVLLELGADIIVADYVMQDELVAWLLDG